MPLTIKHINKNGQFEVRDSANLFIGNGRAKVSKSIPGMVVLFFPQHIIDQMNAGIRVPIDWTDSAIYEEGKPTV